MSRDGSYKKIMVSSSTSVSQKEDSDEEVIYVGETASSVTQKDAFSEDNSRENTQSKKTSNEYHEQTLEDLNNVNVPFQKTQRIVLIVMALVVIAFCVYWFGLR